MSTFVEKGMLKDLKEADRQRTGVFERDPDMEEFFVSGPAVAAGLKLQHAFECQHSKERCREIVVWYTRQGGDLGVGQKYLREACGLKPLGTPPTATSEDVPKPSKSVELGILPEPALDEDKADQDRIITMSCYAAKEMNNKGLEFLTNSRWAQLNMRGCDMGGLKKIAVWESFLQSGYWRDVGRIANSPLNLMPIIRFRSNPGSILAPPTMDFTDSKCGEFLQRQ